MPSITRLSFLLLVIALPIAGCSLYQSEPDQTQIEATVKKTFPSLDFHLTKTDFSKLGDKLYQINFKGTLSSKENLYVPADVAKIYQEHGLDIPKETNIPFFGGSSAAPHLKFLSLATPANKEYEVYGKCNAEYTVDKWQIAFENFDSSPDIQGSPRSAYDPDYLVVDSPEANAALNKLVQQKNDLAAKRQHVLDSLIPFIPEGAVFEGQVVYKQQSGGHRETQKIRITFQQVSKDGKNISAIISNPDDNMDSVPIQGTINTDAAVDTQAPDSDPIKQFHLTYPIEVINDRNKASRRNQLRSWDYYTQFGFHFWLGIRDGKLVGKAGYDLGRLNYDLEVQKK